MTLLSLEKFNYKMPLLALAVLSGALAFFSSTASANTCSKSDVEYYLQRGFTNDQVVLLCAGAVNQQNNQRALVSQAPVPAQTQYSQQGNTMREDQSYLSAALDASDVTLNSQGLSFSPNECIEYGTGLGKHAVDLQETICVGTRLSVDFSGLSIGRATRGLFLVKEATVDVKGNIKREFVGINNLRRQDQEAILSTLKSNPDEVKIRIRRGIDPNAVADRLKKYIK